MLGKYIRLIRTKKHIKQLNLLPNRNRSKGAKIEKNDVVFTYDLLKEICTNIGLTLEEFIYFTEFSSKEERLLLQYRLCLKYPNNEEHKQKFLKDYRKVISKSDNERTIKESRLIFTIHATLSLYWNEISSLTEKDINDLYKELINQDIYSQYDYMVLCNGASYFSFSQLKQLVKKAYPVYLNQRRNHDTKIYANTFMLNSIDMCINYNEFEKGLFYSNMLLRHTDVSKDYFILIYAQYLQHICKGFVTQDYKEFSEAYILLDVLRNIGQEEVAKELQISLDKRLKDPEHILNREEITYVKLNNLD